MVTLGIFYISNLLCGRLAKEVLLFLERCVPQAEREVLNSVMTASPCEVPFGREVEHITSLCGIAAIHLCSSELLHLRPRSIHRHDIKKECFAEHSFLFYKLFQHIAFSSDGVYHFHTELSIKLVSQVVYIYVVNIVFGVIISPNGLKNLLPRHRFSSVSV